MKQAVEGIEIRAPVEGRFGEVLRAEALEFVAGLHREFDSVRRGLLARRAERQAEVEAGGTLAFLARRPTFAKATGGSPQSRPTSRIAASRSPAPPTARW